MLEEFNYTIGAELEFYLFDENGEPVADLESGEYPRKQFDILPQHQALLDKLTEAFSSFKIEKEDGPGQLEAHFTPANDYKELANEISSFKQQAIDFAIENNCEISFSARPISGQPGSSLHIHLSSELFDPYGLQENNGMMSPKSAKNNDYMLWAIGGCLEKLSEDKSIFLPSEDSIKRISGWKNAPTKICWGLNNRSVAIRVPDSKPKRLEHRVSGADVVPELVCKAVIDAAKYGIDNKVSAGEPVFGNAWDGKYSYELLL